MDPGNPDETPGTSPRLERLRIPILSLLLAVLFLEALLSMRQLSITWDEHAYIAAGYSYVATGDFRLNAEQAPLMKLIFGAPYVVLRPEIPTDSDAWTAYERGVLNTQWRFAREFLSQANPDGQRLIFWSRFPVILVACLLCVLVYCWARELYGTAAGLFAAGLCAFSPSILAHSNLATTEIGITCFFFLAAYTFWRYVRRPSTGRLLLAGLGCGLALGAKFTGVFLLPLYAAWAALLPVVGPDRDADTHERLTLLRRTGLAALAIVAIGFLFTSLTYFAPGRVDLYLRSMAWVGYNHSAKGLFYLLGEYSSERFPHYFVVAFLLKTSAAILALLALRLALNPLQRGERLRDQMFLWLPVGAFVFVISWKAANIGVRYLLPIYPFLFVYISGLLRAPAMKKRAVQVAVAALGLYAVVGALRAYPDYLSYFNDLVGGPSRGIRYLAASNVDWGQNMKRLGTWLENNDIDHVRLLYASVFDPGLYGVRGEYTTPEQVLSREPGVYVIGVKEGNRYRRTARDGRERSLLDMLGPPTAIIGHTMYVYDFR